MTEEVAAAVSERDQALSPSLHHGRLDRPQPVITVRNLSKSYGATKAVDDLSFEVETGSLFAFLGQNGAGKTTTISCLTTSLPFDHGEIVLNGHRLGANDDRARRDIGVVFQQSLLDPLLTPKENLRVRASLYGLGARAKRRIEELCELVEIGEFVDRPYGRLSGGEKRRVDIARALVHRPSVLFLDEPTTGLDPKSREQVWTLFRTLREEYDLTLFLTTHYMHETEEADNVVVIDHGRKVAEGTPADLMADHSRQTLTLTMTDSAAMAGLLAAGGRMIRQLDETRAEVVVSGAAEALALLNEVSGAMADFEFRHGTMDDVFLALTDHAAIDEVGAR